MCYGDDIHEPTTYKASKPKLDRPKFERIIYVDDSELITSISYDTETSVLDAHFKNGAKYRYRNVGALLFARVVTAKSVGKAFNEEIKPLPSKRLPR